MAEIDDLIALMVDTDDASDRYKVVSDIAKRGTEAIPALMTFVHEKKLDVRDRFDGIVAVVWMRNIALDAVLEMLHSDDPIVRGCAWDAMTEWAGDIEPFHDEARKALSDPAPAVRSGAIRWARRHWLKDTAPQIGALLSDPDDDVRTNAIKALDNREFGAAFVSKLCDLLHDPVLDVRRSAARTLISIGDPTAVPSLIEALNDPDPMVRLDATTALGACRTEEGMNALLKLVSEASVHAPNVQAIRSLGWFQDARLVPRLLPLLASSNSAIRLATAEALGEIADADALPALVERLERDPQMEVRWQSAKSLGMIAHADAVPALIAALNDHAPTVRSHAVFALGEIHDRRAIMAIRKLAADEDEGVRRAVTFNLKKIEGITS